MTTIRQATLDDLDNIKTLHARYQLQTISEEDKQDGFVTTAFSDEQWQHVIEVEQSMCIAVNQGKVVGYVIGASWQFFAAWPLFAHMIDHLAEKSLEGNTLNTDNSYQYGPVCIAKEFRNTGLFESLFSFSQTLMSKKYPYMVTFINKANGRSFAAHQKKTPLEVVSEFEFKGQYFYELATTTKNRQ